MASFAQKAKQPLNESMMLNQPLPPDRHVFTVFFERLVLFIPSEVRHVGGDERELASENFRRLGQATRGHGHFMRAVVLGLLRQRLFQQAAGVYGTRPPVNAPRRRADL